ncbi:hypothetical protein ABZV41_43395 [Streptomyces sp. NPDC005098]|uniref:hypothetical protein n=1 Tax=Streptomyces sp. NPDC005098 TaxID=3154560 RepID=UPI0033A6C9E8
MRGVSQYQRAGTNARLRLFALLAAQDVPASEVDDLMAALEAGAVAGAESEVAELDGMAPSGRGEVFGDGWDEGVTTVSEVLVQIADRSWEQRSGRSAGAAELAMHVADVRQRERHEVERLRAFVREMVLARTHPNTAERRQVLEVLGEAGSLCNARTVELSTGDVITCTREADHFDPDDRPSWKEGKPGGWHHCNRSMWDDSAAYSHPHTPA